MRAGTTLSDSATEELAGRRTGDPPRGNGGSITTLSERMADLLTALAGGRASPARTINDIFKRNDATLTEGALPSPSSRRSAVGRSGRRSPINPFARITITESYGGVMTPSQLSQRTITDLLASLA